MCGAGQEVRLSVMIILLHCHHQRHAVKCHDSQPEILLVLDFADILHECVQIEHLDTVDVGDEVGGS